MEFTCNQIKVKNWFIITTCENISDYFTDKSNFIATISKNNRSPNQENYDIYFLADIFKKFSRYFSPKLQNFDTDSENSKIEFINSILI